MRIVALPGGGFDGLGSGGPVGVSGDGGGTNGGREGPNAAPGAPGWSGVGKSVPRLGGREGDGPRPIGAPEGGLAGLPGTGGDGALHPGGGAVALNPGSPEGLGGADWGTPGLPDGMPGGAGWPGGTGQKLLAMAGPGAGADLGIPSPGDLGNLKPSEGVWTTAWVPVGGTAPIGDTPGAGDQGDVGGPVRIAAVGGLPDIPGLAAAIGGGGGGSPGFGEGPSAGPDQGWGYGKSPLDMLAPVFGLGVPGGAGGDGLGSPSEAGGTGRGAGGPAVVGGGPGGYSGPGLPQLPPGAPVRIAGDLPGLGSLAGLPFIGGAADKSVPKGLYVGVSGSFDMPMGVTTSDYEADAEGMKNLLAEVRKRTNVHVTVEERFVPMTMENIKDTPIIHIRGHRAFSFTEDERKALREYVANGGTIFGEDSHGPFGPCFRREMKKIFGQAPKDLPADHDLYHSYYVLDTIPQGDMGERYPLQGIAVGDRLGVIYSRNDYGDCWEGTGSWVKPEAREPAFRIGTNIYIYVVAHASKSRKAPAAPALGSLGGGR